MKNPYFMKGGMLYRRFQREKTSKHKQKPRSKIGRLKPFEDGGVEKDEEAATLSIIYSDKDDVIFPIQFLKMVVTTRNADTKPWK